MSIIDENYTMGLPHQIFAVNNAFAEDLLEARLQLQPAKSQCYILEAFRDAEWDKLQGNILNGVLKNSDGDAVAIDGNAFHGITTCNVPIGKEGFVQGYLEQIKNRITSRFEKITAYPLNKCFGS